MTKLSVNLNKIALLRNSRGSNYPNLIEMAKRAITAGADGITVHPRPDQRHITYQDCYDLAALLKAHGDVELNIEGNPTPKFLAVVGEVKPHQCTLVPDSPEQLTSDHGWNLEQEGKSLSPTIQSLQAAGVRVSLFLDPYLFQIDLAKETGTDRIELYTEAYAKAFTGGGREEIFHNYLLAAKHACHIGLGVNAGHDLNLENLPLFLTIPGILEVSIGHAIIVESFDYGFEQTIKKYLAITKSAKGETP